MSGARISLMSDVEFSRNVSIHARELSARRYSERHTFSCYLVSIQYSSNRMSISIPSQQTGCIHIVGLFVSQDSVYQYGTIDILLWAPRVPWVLSVMQIRKHGQFQSTVRSEGYARFLWIRIKCLGRDLSLCFELESCV